MKADYNQPAQLSDLEHFRGRPAVIRFVYPAVIDKSDTKITRSLNVNIDDGNVADYLASAKADGFVAVKGDDGSMLLLPVLACLIEVYAGTSAQG